MSSRLAAAKVLLAIAFRNLFVSRTKSLIVGGIVLVGAVVVVVGSSMVESIDSGMRSSVQGSLGGQLQVYSARSKEELSLYGKPGGDQSQLEPIENFAALKRVISAVPNVREVVPMAMDVATLTAGNEFDAALEKLRSDARQRAQGGGDAALAGRYEAHKAHVRRMVALLEDDLRDSSPVLDPQYLEDRARQRADRERAASGAFWASFDADPLGNLEFLENRIAPQSLSNPFMLLRYVGTDLDAYPRAFDRMRIVEGTSVPKGERGLLIGKLFAEDWLKLRAARLLDQVHEARASRGRRIAGDDEAQRWLKEARGRTREILQQLDPAQAAEATARLRRALGSSGADLQALLSELFTCDDANFDRHYAVFYEELAPLLRLYSVGVGDRVVLNAYSKSGYMNAVTLKVYGFFEFRGLEKSSVAGWLGVMDIRSWRELYGYMTPERAAEIRALKAEVRTRDVSREDADAELFGAGPAETSERARPERIEIPVLAGATPRAEAGAAARAGTQQEIDQGVALNAAIVLHDPARLKETLRDLKSALDAAHMDMRIVGWQEAAGTLGQFVSLARIVLYTAVALMFAVALVIINNAMVMATLRRVKEIGTLRAIGAQKRFVVAMLLLETGAVGLAFGAAGTLLGAGLVVLIRAVGGIPATNDDMHFFFAGASLMPQLGALGLAVALAVAFVVSLLSGLYPALVATRVTPLEAMQSDD
jgi:ABC-type lipoprotein release transport system permease subunit